MAVEFVSVPDIGGAEGAEVIELLVAVGDSISVEQGLIVLESDKASMEIPSTVAGTVVELLVAEGDELAEGAHIVRVELAADDAEDSAVGDEQTAAAEPKTDADLQAAQDSEQEKEAKDTPQHKAKSETKPEASEEVEGEPSADSAAQPAGSQTAAEAAQGKVAAQSSSQATPSVEQSKGVYAGPAVRKLAREFGVPLDQVTGSGPQGRVVKEDLHAFSQKALSSPSDTGAGIPAVPETDFSRFGEVERTTRSKLDRLTADNMHRSWLNVPHVTQIDSADITDLETFRQGLKTQAESRGVKVSPLPFVIKACALALRDNPQLNASLAADGKELVYKRYFNIGMAVDTPAGLMVPVLRDVDKKSIWELAAEVAELAEKARERKLSPADMQGGCFTVSSLGSIGGEGFTPIVNTPEVGILGVSKASVQAVWDGAAFVPRTLLPLSLSYDHRVVNGGHGGRFLSRIVQLLGDVREFIL